MEDSVDDSAVALTRGTQRRTDLGAVPCRFRHRGEWREWTTVDVFEVRDDIKGTDYVFLCVDDVELKLTRRQANALTAIIEG